MKASEVASKIDFANPIPKKYLDLVSSVSINPSLEKLGFYHTKGQIELRPEYTARVFAHEVGHAVFHSIADDELIDAMIETPLFSAMNKSPLALKYGYEPRKMASETFSEYFAQYATGMRTYGYIPKEVSSLFTESVDLIEAAITHELEDNEIIFRVTELLKPYKKSLGRLNKEGKGIKIETNAQVYNSTQGVDYPATVVVKVGMEEDEDLVQLLNNTLKAIANEYLRKTISLMNKEYWSLAILSQ